MNENTFLPSFPLPLLPKLYGKLNQTVAAEEFIDEKVQHPLRFLLQNRPSKVDDEVAKALVAIVELLDLANHLFIVLEHHLVNAAAVVIV